MLIDRYFNFKILVNIVFFFLLSVSLSAGSYASSILVLNYHDIPEVETDLFSVSQNSFKQQLDYLSRNNYKTISLADFTRSLSGQYQGLPEKPVLLTFDDGLDSHYSTVYPLLKKHGFTGAFFINTSGIGQQGRLSSKQILEMARNGHSFGSHSVSHESLVDLSEEEVMEELATSKEVLEHIIDKPIGYLAYPFGIANESLIRNLKDAGYIGAFTVASGVNSAVSNPFLLRRLVVNRHVDMEIFTRIIELDRKVLMSANIGNIKYYMDRKMFFNAKIELDALLEREPGHVQGKKLREHLKGLEGGSKK